MKKVLFNTKLTGTNKILKEHVLEEIKKYKIPKSSEALEIGIGNGRFGFVIGKSFKRYYGIEPDKEYLKIARESKPRKDFVYRRGRAEEIPFKRKFDVVLYSFSWHFVKDRKKAIEETKRVLKDDGILLIIDPKEDSNRWADKRLVKGSEEYDRKLHRKKVRSLRKSKKFIEKQKLFKVVNFNSEIFAFWILKKR